MKNGAPEGNRTPTSSSGGLRPIHWTTGAQGLEQYTREMLMAQGVLSGIVKNAEQLRPAVPFTKKGQVR